MQIFIFLAIVLFSSCYVLFLSFIVNARVELLRAIVLPVVILLIFMAPFFPRHSEWREFKRKWGRRFFLLWGTIFVQMLVLATGGLQSPFLILLYLFMVTISFIFSFSLAVVFLGASLTIIFINLSFTQSIAVYLLEDPRFTVLHIVSLITILPLAFLISRQYHLRDMVFGALHAKVKTDEAIMKHLKELILITDSNLTVLSVNDAVEQTLQKSRSELLGHPLFTVLVLRYSQNKIASKETFFPQGDTGKQPKTITTGFDLLLTPLAQRQVSVQVQSTKGVENTIRQISFILSDSHSLNPAKGILSDSLERTRAKYEALSEHVRQELLRTNQTDLITQSSLMREIENDMYYVQFFSQHQPSGMISSIDTAKLVKQTVEAEQELAKALRVKLDFSIKNFGEKDVAPLTVKNYPVAPEQLTGPFFTVKTDVRRFELLIKKLSDIAVFLSSGQKDARVSVSIERGVHETVIVTMTATCDVIAKEALPDLFLPYYGKLYDRVHLHTGSGFEGYLAKTVANDLSYTLDTAVISSPQQKIKFTLMITKRLAI